MQSTIKFGFREFLIGISLLHITFVVLLGCQPKIKDEVTMACVWVLHDRLTESFVFNLDKKEVYWVNENKRYPLNEVNEGRIVFQGVRSSLGAGGMQNQKDIPIKFIINRVTGELYIEGIRIPSGYDNKCVTTEKVI